MRRTYIKRRPTVLHFSPLVDPAERSRRLSRWVWGRGLETIFDMLPILRFEKSAGVSDMQRGADR